MDKAALDFFKRVLATPSPSGYEGPVQTLVREYASGFADRVSTDVHGNVIAVKNPDAPLRVMLAGHCDQIGLLVSYVDSDGFVYVQTIGGWDPMQLIGQRLTVWTDKGPVEGVIARKPIHLLTDEERKQVPKIKDLWLDIGARNKDEALERVRIGDPVTLALEYTELPNNRACSPAMDNKSGLWVVIEALRRASARGLRVGLYAVSTVQEEIGLRGAKTSAHSIAPHVGIAVDVTHATDCPTIDKKEQGDVALGNGPVVYRGPNMNLKVTQRLIDVAASSDIRVQPAAIGRATPNDANMLQISRGGVATGLISIPNRYMHSAVEMVSLDDIDRAAELIANFAVGLSGDEDFTP
jgi:tetrahedral aminopeptidase